MQWENCKYSTCVLWWIRFLWIGEHPVQVRWPKIVLRQWEWKQIWKVLVKMILSSQILFRPIFQLKRITQKMKMENASGGSAQVTANKSFIEQSMTKTVINKKI